MRNIVLVLLCTAVCNNALGSPPPSIEGEYKKPFEICFHSTEGLSCEGIYEEGIAVQKRNKSSYYLYAKTRGVNANFCQYYGIARWEKDQLVSRSKDCTVAVSFDGDIATLGSNGEGCLMACSSRASLGASDLKKQRKRGKNERSGT